MLEKWIKCNERLPELNNEGNSDTVLVVGKKGTVLLNFIYHYKWKLPMEVTHWMPMPELPEEYL